MSQPSSFPSLRLANGTALLLHPTDPEAAAVVHRLAEVLCLGPGEAGREIFISVGGQDRLAPPLPLPPSAGHPVCILREGDGSSAKEVNQMRYLSLKIALLIVPEGGLLIHGGLAEINGEGVILAASSGTGKTTASNRLPPPWRSLSDDATLVVRDKTGRFCAHPWPTWSRFFSGVCTDRWKVEEAVPLRAVFALCRSQEEYTEPVEHDLAVSFLLDSANQINALLRREMSIEDRNRLNEMQYSVANALADTVPVYTLHLSLDGRFWEVIQETLRTDRKSHPIARSDDEISRTEDTTSLLSLQEGTIPIVFHGTSMLPTLRQPELLEVIPYGGDGAFPVIGDVICYRSGEDGKQVVHRVIGIGTDGVLARGDNNWSPDAAPIPYDAIIGRVAFSWKEGEQRHPWRYPGALIHQLLRTRKHMVRLASPAFPLARPILRGIRQVLFHLPSPVHPRVVLFETAYRPSLLLFIRDSVAGEFNVYRGTWTIHRPYSFVLDSTDLPGIELENDTIRRKDP